MIFLAYLRSNRISGAREHYYNNNFIGTGSYRTVLPSQIIKINILMLKAGRPSMKDIRH